MVERSGSLALATTVALAVVRGPVPLAKALAALDVLSDGRLEVGLGPGSSRADYDAAGIAFEERWQRFDEALAIIRALLNGGPPPSGLRHYPAPAGAHSHATVGRCPCGSRVGARAPGWPGSPGRATGGSRPPTTRPPSGSRRHVPRLRA